MIPQYFFWPTGNLDFILSHRLWLFSFLYRDLFSASPMLVIGTTGALLQINAKTMEVIQYYDLQGTQLWMLFLINWIFHWALTGSLVPCTCIKKNDNFFFTFFKILSHQTQRVRKCTLTTLVLPTSVRGMTQRRSE